MKTRKLPLLVAIGFSALLGFAAATGCLVPLPKADAAAPEETTTPATPLKPLPGSPSATTTIDGRYIPNPPAPFAGKINLSAVNSNPAWPPTVVPPKGAPNVLLIMTDDPGYGVSGTLGGVIPTPAMDRIAKAGLRYTQFHSCALCSPTRAALITGRNHHSVGFGVIGEMSTGYPGYDSVITKDKATVGTILRDNGYATSWFGKNNKAKGDAADFEAT
jgi:arylsulfatase